jgi:hypothetical protein
VSLFLKFWNLRERFRDVFWRHSRKPEDVKTVLEDLREFCRADVSCVVVAKDGRIDTHATAVAEGRREVYLRIMQQLNLSDEVLNKMKEHEDD